VSSSNVQSRSTNGMTNDAGLHRSSEATNVRPGPNRAANRLADTATIRAPTEATAAISPISAGERAALVMRPPVPEGVVLAVPKSLAVRIDERAFGGR